MGTLLLRLAAPLQSWGEDSKFETRRTRREPTKSGVIGLLASALGRRRDESLDDLKSLRFAVRVDQEGELLRDYHTARSAKDSYVTERYYLADAVFLAALESSDETFLHTLNTALQAPTFPLFLGRRSCPPTLPLSLGVAPKTLQEALETTPRQSSEWMRRFDNGDSAHLRTLFEAAPGAIGLARVKDSPESFNPMRRQYTYRACEERFIILKNDETNEVHGSKEP